MRRIFLPFVVYLRIPTLLALAALFFLLVFPAKAQDINCTFGMSNIAFGSIDLSTGKSFAATGTFTYMIEFQLDGGGFGTFGDDTTTTVSAKPLEKSDYEKKSRKTDLRNR